MNTLTETLVFLVHAVKQFCFGFETLNETADDLEDGSAAKAFYMAAIYNYIAVFYLLDKGGDPIGGTFYKTLKLHGLEDVLDPIQSIVETPMGSTTFGELVRGFRNKIIVHTNYRDSDLDRLYAAVNMKDPHSPTADNCALTFPMRVSGGFFARERRFRGQFNPAHPG